MLTGWHASHEQFTPANLLKWAREAQEAGFNAAMSSDHIAPWSVNQGESGYAWSWLGAAMQATQIPFGSVAIPGNWRYHPVIIAQAAATLADMFPGRFRWIAAGSGERMNEHVTGDPWPDKEERNARLKEGVEIIRSLWRGETVTRKEGPIPVDEAKIWTLPDTAPLIYGTALSRETAQWLGGWADGLLTVNRPPDELKALIDSFRKGGGEGKPLALQIHVSWAEDEEEAYRQAEEQWSANLVDKEKRSQLKRPEEFDKAAAEVDRKTLEEGILISGDPARHIEWLEEYRSLGFDEIYLHNTGLNQSEFIREFGKKVLPHINQEH